MIKVVIDTNLFVSSIINKRGTPARLLEAWRDHKYLLIISSQMLDEIKRVLQYPHVKDTYNLKDDEIEGVIDTIERFAVVLHAVEDVNVITDDPQDNKVLACALASGADWIVSGDKQLLGIDKFENIPIVSAKKFLNHIESKEDAENL